MTLSIPWADTPFVKIKVGGEDIGVIPNFLKSFTYTLNLGGAASSCEIVLFDPNWDQLENVLIAADRKIEFQWGWANGNASAWHAAFVHSINSKFVWGQGAELTIQTIDAAGDLMNGHTGFSYPADTLASKIATDIANLYGFVPIVEPSKSIGQILNQPPGVTDFAFLNMVKEKAISSKHGNGGYNLLVWQGRELHFHTPGFIPHSEKTYLYYLGRDQNGVITDFEPELNYPALASFGATGMRVMAYDPIKKEVIDYTANNKSLAGLPTNGTEVPKENVEAPRMMRQPIFTFDNAKAVADSRYRNFADSSFRARIEMYGDPEIQAGEIVDVRVLIPETLTEDTAFSVLPERLHYTSGKYEILEVTHSISDSGSYMCSLTGQRRGVAKTGDKGFEDSNGNPIKTFQVPQEPGVIQTPSSAQQDPGVTRQKSSQNGTSNNANQDPRGQRFIPPGTSINGTNQ